MNNANPSKKKIYYVQKLKRKIGSTERNFKMATTLVGNNIGNRKIIIIKGRS